MQSFDYRPNAGRMALATLASAVGAAYFLIGAVNDHRAMLIDHLIYLAPDQATVFRWALGGSSVIGAASGLLGLLQALIGDRQLHVGDEAVERPAALFGAATVTVAYRDITAVEQITVRRHRFLRLRTNKGSVSISGARLDPDAFAVVARLIADGRDRARDAAVRTAAANAAPARRPPAPAAPSPTAPRTFGKRV